MSFKYFLIVGFLMSISGTTDYVEIHCITVRKMLR